MLSKVIVDALLIPPGVVGRLNSDEPETAEADLECLVVEGDISLSEFSCAKVRNGNGRCGGQTKGEVATY